MEKEELLKELKREVKNLPESDRNKFFGKYFTSVISVLSKRLIKYEGYSVMNTILQREITEIGKRDAEEIMKIFNIKGRTPENVSKVLKIAALILGFKLEVENSETIVKECPFAVMARQYNEPLIATICSWYCNGIAKGIVGDDYVWEGMHDIEKEIPVCFFMHIRKE